MRNAIRDKLLSAVPELLDVYEPHAAGPDSEKPYAVVLQGDETEESDWVGFRRIIEVWPYVARTSFAQVDRLEAAIVAALDKQLLTTAANEVFSCLHLGTVGSDFVDREWDGIARGVRFAVIAVQPVAIPETIAPDPWLKVLADWTKPLLGPDWEVYTGAWPLGYRLPCVLWRMTSIETEAGNRAAYKVTKKLSGHIVTATPNERTLASQYVLEHLQQAIKLPLDIAARRYLTVESPRIDNQADAIRTGQLTLSLSRRLSRLDENAPLMEQVTFRGDET